MDPSANRNGTWITAVNVTKAIDRKPITRVDRNSSAVADTMTGARISRAKGFDSPPVRYKRKESWARSNSKVTIASASVRRFFSGKTKTEPRLARMADPTAR